MDAAMQTTPPSPQSDSCLKHAVTCRNSVDKSSRKKPYKENIINHKQSIEKANRGEVYKKAPLMVTKKIISVSIKAKVDAQDWKMFQELKMLSESSKQAFLSDSVQNRLEELLRENPELFSYYALKRV